MLQTRAITLILLCEGLLSLHSRLGVAGSYRTISTTSQENIRPKHKHHGLLSSGAFARKKFLATRRWCLFYMYIHW